MTRASGATAPRTAVMMRDVGIGDLVWLAAYAQRIAASSADGQVTLLAPPTTQARELLGHEPWLREVIDFDRRPRRGENRRGRHAGLAGLLGFAAELSARSIERVVLFTNRPLPVSFACWWAGVGQRLGYSAARTQRLWLTRAARPVELYRGPAVAAYWNATALCLSHGWCDGPLVPRLTVRPDARARMQAELADLPRPLHVLAIGSSEPAKQWGAQRFADLAHLLAARGESVLLLGGPAEHALADAVLTQVPQALRANVRAVTDRSIGESAAILALADTCAGNDTGVANMAAALGTPTWVVLGPRPPLTHDPAMLKLLQAPGLSDIQPADVARHLLATETA